MADGISGRRLGPFAVIGQVGTSAYRLALPPSMHIHSVSHVSLLEPHVANTFPGRDTIRPSARGSLQLT